MAAKYNYRGTKITGTSTAGKKFTKSGIKSAKVGQLYFNTKTGHVYSCTVKGGPKDAKWKYIRTDIARKPTIAVSGLVAPWRESGNRKMKASWKTPDAMLNPKSGSRTTALDISWYLGISGTKKAPYRVFKTTNERATESYIDLNNLKIGRKLWTRSQFYPFKGKPLLRYVTVKVASRNEKGVGKSVMKPRRFGKPRPPAISAGSFNVETGEVGFTITTNAGTDYLERYDTLYTMKVYYSSSKKTVTIIPDTNKTGDNKTGTTTALSKTIYFDDPNYASRKYEDYAKVVITAKARGFAGDSTTTTRVHYVAYPAQAEIKRYTISGKTSQDKVTFYVDTHSTTEHPVDRVKLEYLPNSEYATADEIPGDAGWEATDIVDDAACNAMAMSVTNLIPERGRHTWVRLKTWHDNEITLHRYSNYMMLDKLETPAATAVDDKIHIVSAVPGADGESAVVNLVWDDGEGQPESTGTELSWSDEVDTWRSTKEPEKHEFTWSDGEQVVDGVTWPDSATITIKGLEAGELYYVKARRYNEGDTTTYSEYSNHETVLTSEKPESVVATADRYVPQGSGLNVYWTFSGNGLQQKWQIVKRVSDVVGGVTVWNDDVVLLHGDGSIGSAQIPFEKLQEHADNGSLTYNVQVSTGSGFIASENYSLTIIDSPTLTLNAPAILTQQPYTFTAIASVPSDVSVIISSQGATGQFPEGVRNQTEGDTIHSDVYSPEWVQGYVLTTDTKYLDKKYYSRSGDVFTEVIPESDDGVVDPTINPSAEGWYEVTDGYSAEITIPTGLDFWDLGLYSISAVAIDQQTRLRSNEAPARFSVAWENQAVSPQAKITYEATADTTVSEDKNYYRFNTETQTYVVVEPTGDEDPSAEEWFDEITTNYVTLTPQDYIDDAGFHHKAVQIALTPPQGSSETDVYDIYRVTGDGPRLIGESFPLTHTVVDEYAPFGEDPTQEYRIAIRTVDGDVAFADIQYVLEGEGIRIDWAGGFIEYPYGVSIEDSYSKDVDVRKHLDGTINGYWNEGVSRKGSLSADLIKIIQSDDIDKTRELARYTGPAFVRTREGTAFEADVQITKLSERNLAVLNIAIDAQEIDLTDEFILPIPDRLEESEGE